MKVAPKSWLLVLMAGAGLQAVSPVWSAAQTPFTIGDERLQVASSKPSVIESVSSSVKRGIGKLGRAVTPNPSTTPDDDPVSLSSKGKPSARLYVAVARTFEDSGQLSEASMHYEKALRHTPDYLGALLGYARLKDRMGATQEANALYQRAVKQHPNNASAHNNMALFYAKRGMLNESLTALKSAVRLQPKEAKYRNNIASVLVEMGRMTEAFAQLRAIHTEAVAFYNLGFLLELKRDFPAARRHYALAARKDPTLTQARLAIQRLEDAPRQAQVTRPGPVGPPASRAQGPPIAMPTERTIGPAPPDGGRRAEVRQLPPAPKYSRYGPGLPNVRVRGTQLNGKAPLPHERSIPKRLPPTSHELDLGAVPKSAPLPSGTFEKRTTPLAPLPSAAARPTIRPLPPVD